MLYQLAALARPQLITGTRNGRTRTDLFRAYVLRPVRRPVHPAVDRLKSARCICLAELVPAIQERIKCGGFPPRRGKS